MDSKITPLTRLSHFRLDHLGWRPAMSFRPVKHASGSSSEPRSAKNPNSAEMRRLFFPLELLICGCSTLSPSAACPERSKEVEGAKGGDLPLTSSPLFRTAFSCDRPVSQRGVPKGRLNVARHEMPGNRTRKRALHSAEGPRAAAAQRISRIKTQVLQPGHSPSLRMTTVRTEEDLRKPPGTRD